MYFLLKMVVSSAMLIYQEGNDYHTSVRAIFTLCNIGVDKPLPLALQIVESDCSRCSKTMVTVYYSGWLPSSKLT